MIDNALDYVIDTSGCSKYSDAMLSIPPLVERLCSLLEENERLHVIAESGLDFGGMDCNVVPADDHAANRAFLAEVKADLVHRFIAGTSPYRGIKQVFSPLDIFNVASLSGRFFTPGFFRYRRARKNLCNGAFVFLPSHSSMEMSASLLSDKSHSRSMVLFPAQPAGFVPQSEPALDAVRERFDLPERYFLAIDRTDDDSSLNTLLAAYGALDQTASLPLVIAGADKGRAKLPEGATYLLIESSSTLAQLICASYVFLFPEIGADFPYPLLWAMGCGIPVVAAATRQVREVASSEVKLVHPTDRIEWMRALESAVVSIEWRETARDAGLTRASAYNAAEAADRLIEVYRKITRKTGAL